MGNNDVINRIIKKSEELKKQFPINAFPLSLQKIINHYVEIKGYPSDYLCTGILTAIGIAIGNSHVLHTVNGYEAKSNLFAVIIGRRGFNKSEALTDAFRPIEKFTNALYKEFQNELKSFSKIPEKERKEMNPPFFGKPILSDVTSEATAQQLSKYPKGCGIIVDELAGFLKSFDQYRKKGSDEQFYLSAWSNKPISIDRATKDPIRITAPFLSIIGTTQPGVADQVFYGKEETGFLDRWLICYPDRLTKRYPSSDSVNPAIESRYESILNKLLHIYYEEDSVASEVRYTPDSWRIIYDYICKSTDIENNPVTTATEGGIRSKMDIYIHRFCLILQLASYACGETSVKDKIEPETALNATRLADYFYLQAEKKRITERSELLPPQWKDVFDMLPNHGMHFTTAEFINLTDKMNIPERSAKRFLKDNSDNYGNGILTRIRHGIYAKT